MRMRGIVYSSILCVAMVLIGCGTNRLVLNPKTDSSKNEITKINVTPLPDELVARDHFYTGLRAMLLKDSDRDVIRSHFDSALQNGFDNSLLWMKMGELYPDSLQLAEQYARKAVDADSTNIQAIYLLCDILLKTNDADKALETLLKAKKLAPNNLNIYSYIAAIYNHKGLTYAALNELTEAQNKFGAKESILHFKRELLFKMQLYDKAIKEAEQLAETSPNNIENLIFLGKAYSMKNSPQSDSAAIKTFNSALEIEPQNIEVLSALCNFYASRRNYHNFLETTQKLFELKELPAKNKIKFFNNYIHSPAFYQNHFFQVDHLVNTLLRTHPEDSAVKMTYTTHLIASGKTEQAIQFQKEWIAQNPELISPYEYVIQGELYMKRPDSALVYIDRAIKQFPKNVDIASNKASYYYTINQKDKALKEWKKILKIAKDDSTRCSIYCMMGDITNEIENISKKEVYKYYEKALAIDSMNIAVLNNYSYLLSEDSTQLNKALQLAERMMTREISNPIYLDTYAWVLFKSGQVEKALNIMRRAISLDTTNSHVLLMHYGDVLFESNQKYLARIYWRKALEAGANIKDIEPRIKKLD